MRALLTVLIVLGLMLNSGGGLFAAGYGRSATESIQRAHAHGSVGKLPSPRGSISGPEMQVLRQRLKMPA